MLGKALCSRERSHQPFPKSSLPEPTSPLQLPAQAPGRGMFLLPSPESPAPGGKNSTGRPPKGDTPHFYMENSDLVSKVNMTHVTVRNAFSCKKKKKKTNNSFIFTFYSFIYLGYAGSLLLCAGFSLITASGGYSLLHSTGFSLGCLLLL